MKKLGQYIAILTCWAGLCNTVSAQLIDTVCAGEKAASYRTGPTAGSVYYWTVEDGIISGSSANGSNIFVDWSELPGLKKITVREISANGCPGDTVEAFVLVLPKRKVDILGPEQVCKGEPVLLTAIGGADRYVWNNGSTGATLAVHPETDTSFSVVGYFGECGTGASLHDMRVKYKPQANFEFNPKKPIINEPVQFSYTGTNNVDNWEWMFTEQSMLPEYDAGENVEHRFKKVGVKAIRLFVSNEFGCTDTITKYIVIESGINVFIPTGFTPNLDGHNNVFIPVYENVLSAKLLVYDRWGEKIFSTDSMTEGWDGSYKGKAVADGVFVYVVQVVGMDEKSYVFEGTVTVLR